MKIGKVNSLLIAFFLNPTIDNLSFFFHGYFVKHNLPRMV